MVLLIQKLTFLLLIFSSLPAYITLIQPFPQESSIDDQIHNILSNDFNLEPELSSESMHVDESTKIVAMPREVTVISDTHLPYLFGIRISSPTDIMAPFIETIERLKHNMTQEEYQKRLTVLNLMTNMTQDIISKNLDRLEKELDKRGRENKKEVRSPLDLN